jgi:HD-GYP domain-containing protein (c-di-GMP phosphodiesterase class II)
MHDSMADAKTADKTAMINQQIERAKAELEHMIDLNPQIILLVDQNCNVIRANRKALDFLGMKHFGDILGWKMTELFSCPDPARIEHLIHECHGFTSLDSQVVIPCGSSCTLRFSVIGSGRDMFVVIISDVGEELKKASRIEKQHKKEAVRALAGALMHNINQPLTVIIMRAQMLKIALDDNRTDPAEVRKSLQDIMRLALRISDTLQNVERSNDFITEPYIDGVNILDISRSGGTPVEAQISCSSFLDNLLNALDHRTPGAVSHARICGALSHFIAEKLGLDWRISEITRQAAIVHDIGKIGIPDAIIMKPMALDRREEAIMQKHVVFGYNILKTLIFFDEEAVAVHTHHEKLDGSGYPQGLSGEKIPLSARIIAVADAFEVMRTGRPYRESLPLADTLKEIRRSSGTQFDPAIVGILEKRSEELDRIARG